ncbi:MAG: alpha-amylase family glycosyl hydrolase [Candidatus Thermoplasmatota archaeon]|nr:alpha-amylase family glycosyl hydrolase [Candidatus Thermoplasmatota archaeon]
MPSFFLDACTSKNSPYFNWFHFSKWPDDYLSFLSVKEIPKLNLNNEETKEYIIKVAKYWLSFGLDGFRLDHVIGITNTFWKKFSTEIKKSFPNSILIGEAWMHGISWKELNTIQIPFKKLKWFRKRSSDTVLQNYVPLLDGVLDFTVQHYFKEYFCKENRSMNTMNKFKKKLTNHFSSFPPEFHLPIFLDNHDMDRFLFQCNNNIDQLKKAVRVQFNLSQPIIIYYGTEQKMTQTKSIWELKNHGDLHARKPMPLNNKNKDNELYYFYRNLIHKRLKT